MFHWRMVRGKKEYSWQSFEEWGIWNLWLCLRFAWRYGTDTSMLLLTILCDMVRRAEVRRQERDDHSNCAISFCWAVLRLLYSEVWKPRLKKVIDIINWKGCRRGKKLQTLCYEDRSQRYNLTTLVTKSEEIKVANVRTHARTRHARTRACKHIFSWCLSIISPSFSMLIVMWHGGQDVCCCVYLDKFNSSNTVKELHTRINRAALKF